jgi:hypothetical protein
MVPGFVLLGAAAVLGQLLIIVAIYWYVTRRNQLPDSAARSRVQWLVFSGIGLVGAGQLLALLAIGSLRVADTLTLSHALLVQEIGLAGAVVGYVLVSGGLVARARWTP